MLSNVVFDMPFLTMDVCVEGTSEDDQGTKGKGSIEQLKSMINNLGSWHENRTPDNLSVRFVRPKPCFRKEYSGFKVDSTGFFRWCLKPLYI